MPDLLPGFALPSVHIVESLASKLPSTIQHQPTCLFASIWPLEILTVEVESLSHISCLGPPGFERTAHPVSSGPPTRFRASVLVLSWFLCNVRPSSFIDPTQETLRFHCKARNEQPNCQGSSVCFKLPIAPKQKDQMPADQFAERVGWSLLNTLMQDKHSGPPNYQTSPNIFVPFRSGRLKFLQSK